MVVDDPGFVEVLVEVDDDVDELVEDDVDDEVDDEVDEDDEVEEVLVDVVVVLGLRAADAGTARNTTSSAQAQRTTVPLQSIIYGASPDRLKSLAAPSCSGARPVPTGRCESLERPPTSFCPTPTHQAFPACNVVRGLPSNEIAVNAIENGKLGSIDRPPLVTGLNLRPYDIVQACRDAVTGSTARTCADAVQ